MSRVMLIFATGLLALMAGALFYAARMPVQAPAPVQEPLPQPAALEVVTHPAFTLPDMDGNERQLSDWDGKHRIVNFWATWCAPCRREIPVLKEFQELQAANGFQVIGIAVDYPEAVSRFDETVDFNYPVLVGQDAAMAIAETSGIQFMALPFTMFIAADGEYLNAYMGELHASQLKTIVATMTRLERQEISSDEARAALESL